jgi:hypothetical protein
MFRGLGRATSHWRMDPQFIVIGGQRCGTTTIFKSLSEHPQVVRPPVDKGTDYFTLNYTRGIDWYHSRFPTRAVSALRTRTVGPPVAFEACTYYLFHPYAIERLARDYPDVKLVAMLRDPVQRAFSAYKHEFARGYDTEPDFRRALDREDERLAGEDERLRDPSYESFAHRHHAYRRRGQFAEQLERVFKHYPREQVHVMESEAFFADPAGEYRTLIDFLGLQPWQPASFEQHNARPSKPMPADARAFLEEHYREHDEALARMLGRQPFWLTHRPAS